MSELQELEKKKLEAEIRDLQRPWFSKPSVLVSIVTTLVAGYSLIVTNQRATRVANQANVPLASDVVVAPYHGSSNSSSAEIIAAVSPERVIFSAGHAHSHPQAETVDRYLVHGVDPSRIFSN